MNEPIYTTAEAAAELGVIPRRVRQLAADLGVGRLHGRDYLFTSADVAAMRDRRRIGWPKGTPRKIEQS